MCLVSDIETQTNNDSTATVIPEGTTAETIDTTTSEITEASTRHSQGLSTVSAQDVQRSAHSDSVSNPKTNGGKQFVKVLHVI